MSVSFPLQSVSSNIEALQNGFILKDDLITALTTLEQVLSVELISDDAVHAIVQKVLVSIPRTAKGDHAAAYPSTWHSCSIPMQDGGITRTVALAWCKVMRMAARMDDYTAAMHLIHAIKGMDYAACGI